MNTLPVDFTLTRRAFSADRSRGWAWALVVALAITVGWLAWFVFAQVGAYEVSTAARVEFQSGAADGHPVDAPVDGLIVKIDVAVGHAGGFHLARLGLVWHCSGVACRA